MINEHYDLISGMQAELRKQASKEVPDLVKAAECLHNALEIFESAGLQSRANDVIRLLQKIAQAHTKEKPVQEMPTVKTLMEAGITERDLKEFSRGSPIAKAKFNVVLRGLGLSDHMIGKFIGTANVMSDEDAKAVADPTRSFSKMWNWVKDPNAPTDPAKIEPGQTLEFESIAQKKTLKNDRHTKGLTPEKMVANLKDHGTEFNLADILYHSKNIGRDDVDPELADLLDIESFDIDASDDELMGMEVKEDSLEVFDNETEMQDFEDEKD